MSNIYQVESIVGHRQRKGKDYFLVHWQGYSKEDNTWEPVENLKNCQALIDNYMDQQAAERRRKSLRTRPTPTRDTLQLSSDDEGPSGKVTKTRNIQAQKPMKRTTRSSATPTKLTTHTDTRRQYYLRSVPGEFSSEDESALEVSTKKTKTTRMSLSESRFRKQLDDIKKGKYSSSPRKTSTPQKVEPEKPPKPAPISSTKVQAKTKLLFNNPQSLGSSPVYKSSILTRQQQRLLEEEITVAEQPPTVAEADDSETDYQPSQKSTEESAPAVKESPSPWPEETEEKQCFPVTWREFALAAFVTGVAAVGYICYTTDYCSY